MQKTKPLILAVDDMPEALYALEQMLIVQGFDVVTASNGDEVLQAAKEHPLDVILLDVVMPKLDGLKVAQILKSDSVSRYIPIILLTGKDSLDDIVQGLAAGADDYLCKPFNALELIARVKAALRTRELYKELASSYDSNCALAQQLTTQREQIEIIGSSKAICSVIELAKKIAQSDSPVLITGESGTGKELIAQLIHRCSNRASNVFLAKNCAAFSEGLLESELFGHIKGAFTGALRDQKGLFQAAHKGTLFLDEVGEMSNALQAKLLRVLQNSMIMPVGTNEEIKVDVRVIAATNKNIDEMLANSSMREDLYYRLKVLEIRIPPLRERKEDIPLLVDHFLKTFEVKHKTKLPKVSDEAMQAMYEYSWRGNVRELEHEIERMAILGVGKSNLGVELLSPNICGGKYESAKVSVNKDFKTKSLKDALNEVTKSFIIGALERNKYNKSIAAKELGMSRSSLIEKVKGYKLNLPDDKDAS